MGQKVNPIGLRLGIIRGWESNWYGGKNFADKLIEDEKIRNYLNARIQKGGIAKIIIERTIKRIIITIHTSRPGIVIGKGGTEVDKIKEEIKKFITMEKLVIPPDICKELTEALDKQAWLIKIKLGYISQHCCGKLQEPQTQKLLMRLLLNKATMC